MGTSGSKVIQKGARRYPSRAPGAVLPTQAPRPSRPPPEARQPAASSPKASYTKDDAIHADSIDPGRPESLTPDFASRLKQIGVVQPNPTFSPSSTASPIPDLSAMQHQHHQQPPAPNFPAAANNTTLGVLEARRRLQELADEEFENMGKSGYKGKEFLDVATIRDVLMRRQRGEAPAAIEARLRLKPGVVSRLGPVGVVSAPANPGP